MKHYRATRKKYIHHSKTDKQEAVICAFCDRTTRDIVEENDTAYVIVNRVPYDLFDGARVLDHLMVIPKEHRISIKEFSDQELTDMFRLAGKYEAEGYGVYARGKGAITRSIAHQHTHLIKLADTTSKFVLYTQKPYILFEK